MFQFAIFSARLFTEGKLFRDGQWVLRQGLLSTGIVLAEFFVFRAIGIPLLVTVAMTSFLGGLVVPYLFRDLRAG